MDVEITLLGTTSTQDEFGVWRESSTSRTVLAQLSSVSRNEFFSAGQLGLAAEYVFSIFSAEYHGERTLIYQGRRYGIYRTYLTDDDYIELYAERKAGVTE